MLPATVTARLMAHQISPQSALIGTIINRSARYRQPFGFSVGDRGRSLAEYQVHAI
jgi:hypothetical protein